MRMYICMLFNIKIRTLKKVEKQKSRMAIMRADRPHFFFFFISKLNKFNFEVLVRFYTKTKQQSHIFLFVSFFFILFLKTVSNVKK